LVDAAEEDLAQLGIRNGGSIGVEIISCSQFGSSSVSFMESLAYGFIRV
jgi:hypothetical protein